MCLHLMKKKRMIQLEGLQNIKGRSNIYQIMLSMERMLRAITNYRVPLKLLIVNLLLQDINNTGLTRMSCYL
jgi:hypothetical protein